MTGECWSPPSSAQMVSHTGRPHHLSTSWKEDSFSQLTEVVMFTGKLAIMVAGHILGTGVGTILPSWEGAGWSKEQRTVCTPWCLGGCQREDTGSNPVVCGDHSHDKSLREPRNQGPCFGAVS